MDEYLFTVLAKLKTDRLTLEKAAHDKEIEALDDYYQQRSPSPRARRSDPLDLSGVIPTHGLRGWS